MRSGGRTFSGGIFEGFLSLSYTLARIRLLLCWHPENLPSCNLGPRYGGQYLKTLGVRKIFTIKYFELLDSEKGNLWTLAGLRGSGSRQHPSSIDA